MKPDQDLCDCAAALLIANRPAGLPPEVQILARHATAAQQRPCLVCATEDMKNPHPKLARGVFLLRYLADGDDETAGASQAALTAAAEWLAAVQLINEDGDGFDPGGFPLLQQAMQARGNWLRRLVPGDSPVEQDGARGRTYDQRFTVWIQTGL